MSFERLVAGTVLIIATLVVPVLPLSVAWMLAVAAMLAAYVPLVRVLWLGTRPPASQLVYLAVSLQLSNTLVNWALYAGDRHAFVGLCGSDGCSGRWHALARVYYYSASTFTGVGLGDIAPRSLAATLLSLPLFYAYPLYLIVLMLYFAR